MTSSRNELVSYLDNWQEPLKPSDLADALGLSLATVRVYKSRMDTDPVSYPISCLTSNESIRR